jgi:hypothetical protein
MKVNCIGNSYPSIQNKKAVSPVFKSDKYQKIYQKMNIELTNMFYGHRQVGFHSPDGYCEAIKNFKVKDLLTLQGESAVFLMEDDNQILKMSCYPYAKYLPEFHAPEIARGVITTDKKYRIIKPLDNLETDKFYWVIQKKGIMHVSDKDKNELLDKVTKAGYKVEDIKWDQFAYFDGKAKFIDLGCILEKE